MTAQEIHVHQRRRRRRLSDMSLIAWSNTTSMLIEIVLYTRFTVFSVACAMVRIFSPPGLTIVVVGVVFGRMPVVGVLAAELETAAALFGFPLALLAF